MEIKVMKNIMDVNNKIADSNRDYFTKHGMTVLNVMASPGAGKTSIIMKLVELSKRRFSVIEGDIASSIDAQKIEGMGIHVVQINTNGGCHLDANMIHTVVEGDEVFDKTILFIENVGNLVCPSSFDLGEGLKLVIASVPEGHDKPFKYTSMFEAADVIILNKTDLLPYIDFDKDVFYKGIRSVNIKARVLEVSCRTGEGLAELVHWIDAV
jgi:hydrogenase nickel incorporation protein HypB